MLTRLTHSIRHNIVAYAALFIALGGTSWAAVNLPVGSVGNRQLRNRSITPGKFNPQYINGTVRAWAVVAPNGTIQSGAGKPTVLVESGTPGLYVIKWKKVATATQRGCFAIGGLNAESGQSGAAEATLFVPRKGPWAVDVNTYGPQGQRLPQYFYTAVIC